MSAMDRNFSVISRPSYSPLGVRRSGLIRTGLLLFVKDGTTDNIGLSVEDYALLDAYWQGVFFTDSDTPITHTFDNWLTLLLADANINVGSVLAVDNSGFAVYRDGTVQPTLDSALSYLERHVVVPPAAVYWQNIDGTNITDVNGNPIEVFS